MLNSQPCQQQMEARKKHIRSLFLSRAPLTAPHQGGTEQGFWPRRRSKKLKENTLRANQTRNNLI